MEGEHRRESIWSVSPEVLLLYFVSFVTLTSLALYGLWQQQPIRNASFAAGIIFLTKASPLIIASAGISLAASEIVGWTMSLASRGWDAVHRQREKYREEGREEVRREQARAMAERLESLLTDEDDEEVRQAVEELLGKLEGQDEPSAD